MKNIKMHTNFKRSYFAILAFLLLTVTGCDLAIQEQFDFEEGIGEIPIQAATALDYIQQDPRNLFTNLGEAIALLGMDDEYRAADRTHFLLMDDAWTEGNGIFNEILGNPEASVADIVTAEDRDLLRRILTYHMIEGEVIQVSLPEFDTQFSFRTMLPGANGEMVIHRQFSEWNMSINNNDNNKPTRQLAPGGSKKADIKFHNILFENSTSHLVDRAARWGDSW